MTQLSLHFDRKKAQESHPLVFDKIITQTRKKEYTFVPNPNGFLMDGVYMHMHYVTRGGLVFRYLQLGQHIVLFRSTFPS